jgi:hypothetical protein
MAATETVALPIFNRIVPTKRVERSYVRPLPAGPLSVFF